MRPSNPERLEFRPERHDQQRAKARDLVHRLGTHGSVFSPSDNGACRSLPRACYLDSFTNRRGDRRAALTHFQSVNRSSKGPVRSPLLVRAGQAEPST